MLSLSVIKCLLLGSGLAARLLGLLFTKIPLFPISSPFPATYSLVSMYNMHQFRVAYNPKYDERC